MRRGRSDQATEALTKPEDPVGLPKYSTLREPPEEPFAADLDDAGLPVEVNGVNEEPGEPFFDELPADDWEQRWQDREGEVRARNHFADSPAALVLSTVHGFKGHEARGVVLALHNMATPQELYVGLTRVSAKRGPAVLVVLCPNPEWSEAVAPYVHFWP